MKATSDAKGNEQVPDSVMPTTLVDGCTILDTKEQDDDHCENKISEKRKNPVLPMVSLDIEDVENSTKATSTVEQNSKILVAGASGVNDKDTPSLLDSYERGAGSTRGASRRKTKQNLVREGKQFEKQSAFTQGKVDRSDNLYLSPGAISVQLASTSENAGADEELMMEGPGHTTDYNAVDFHNDNYDAVEEGLGTEDHYDQPSMIVTARLVPDDTDEHLERRIQEGVESRLQSQKGWYPQPPTTTAVVAEAVVPTVISGGVDALNPSSKAVDQTKAVCGLQRRALLIIVFLVVTIATITGVLAGLFSNSPPVAAQFLSTPTATPTVSAIPTLSPTITAAPTQPLEDQLEPWIIRTEEDRAIIENPSSPQSRALKWLSTDSLTHSGDLLPFEVLERYILAVLYFSTNGPNWPKKQDAEFLTAAHVCEWRNYLPSDNIDAWGVVCGDRQNVVHIWLGETELSGTIPWELSLLSDMSWIYMPYNSLIGTIPTELGQLSLLDEIEINSNQLEGPIPTELGRLSRIIEIEFNDNQLEGSIPTEIGLLTTLTSIDFDGNLLTGTLPTELGLLIDLESLILGKNKLTGTLPTQLGQMTAMQDLILYSNFLTGTLPTELGQMITMLGLALEDNLFNGTVPTELGNLTSLEYVLSVEGNLLTGTLPTELGNLVKLQALYANVNKLIGTIPTELANLVGLQLLSIDTNALTGTLPTELGNLVQLGELNIFSNQLTGSLPTVLSELRNLKKFLFHKNDLTGSVTASLCAGTTQWVTLQSDCLATNGTIIEIECTCCTMCCNIDGEYCQETNGTFV